MNVPAGSGGADGSPHNGNDPPEHLSTFRDRLDVADLRQVIDNADFEDVSLEPEIDSLRVPGFMTGHSMYAPSVKIADLIDARIPAEADCLLIASFHRLSFRSAEPILAFCIRELVPLIALAAAHFTEWNQAFLPPVRKSQPLLLCYPGKGLMRHLGIALSEEGDGRLGNGLFLIDRPRDVRSPRFLATHLPERADAPHDLTEIRDARRLLRQLPER